MNIIFVMSIFWIIYGIAGILGFQVIPKKFKEKDWTKSYIRKQGLSWIILGAPWLILYLIINDKTMDIFAATILFIVCAIPSFVYTIILDRKYKAMLKDCAK